jgi:alkylhydroperoxidase family enzyme
MAAYVSNVNESALCFGAHTATARRAYHDGANFQAVLADLESASVEEPLRATLRMLDKLTRQGTVDAENMREVLSAGVSRQQVENALAVCVAFNTTDRSPTPSASKCSAPRASRQERSTCSSGGYR